MKKKRNKNGIIPNLDIVSLLYICLASGIFFSSIALLSLEQKYKIPFLSVGVTFLLYWVTTRLYLKKIGIERFRDLTNVRTLKKFPKADRRSNISYVAIVGMLFSLIVSIGLSNGLSLFFPKDICFIVLVITIIFSFLYFIKLRGIIIEAPERIGKYESIIYKLPLRTVLKSFVKVCAFILAMGSMGTFLYIYVIYPRPPLWGIFKFYLFLLIFINFVVIPLFLVLRNILLSPILIWVKRNIRCPNCGGSIGRASVGVSEFSLIKLVVVCKSCNRKFNLGTRFIGRSLYFYE